jgi:hypothetical protein
MEVIKVFFIPNSITKLSKIGGDFFGQFGDHRPFQGRIFAVHGR